MKKTQHVPCVFDFCVFFQDLLRQLIGLPHREVRNGASGKGKTKKDRFDRISQGLQLLWEREVFMGAFFPLRFYDFFSLERLFLKCWVALHTCIDL